MRHEVSKCESHGVIKRIAKNKNKKNYLLSLKPTLIFIDECEKIKLFICLDKVAVKEYRKIFSSL